MVIFVAFSQIALADTDYNQAKQLLDAGEILPLEKILTKIAKYTSGHILEVELEIDDDRPLYEIEFIDNKGLVWKLKVNAKTGKIIERKQDD
jgi:uncharacterized membrane protein YkoI